MRKHVFLLAFAGSMVVGCGYVQRHDRPEFRDMPSTYHSVDSSGAFSEEAWWKAFHDETLNRLMMEAIENSPSLEGALARLQQFRAQSRATRANLFPTVTAQGSYQDGERAFGGLAKISLDYYDISAVAQYELDLWGKLTARRRAAFGDLLASENDVRTALLTLTSQVARTYFQIRDLQEQQRLVDQTIETLQNAFETVTDRYMLGLVTSLDVYQAEGNLAQARAQKETIDASLSATEHLLSVLIGRYPQTEFLDGPRVIPATNLKIETGVPSDLLTQRPDIRAARARLLASDARWASANAALLPSFTLTGTLGNINKDIEAALDPDEILWNLVAGVTAPIFQGGRLVGEAQRAEATAREAAATYKQVVLNAFREVEDALVRGTSLAERIAQLETQTAAAGNLLRVADEQYRQGLVSYLQVLVAQNTYYQAQSSLISARRELHFNRIDLATAVGGTWTDDVLRARIASTKLHTEAR